LQGARTHIRWLALLALTGWVATDASRADLPFLSEKAVRTEIVGRTLTGYYVDGQPWTETYLPDTGISYQDRLYSWSGTWSFEGSAFCTFYNQRANGGCWLVRKISANCFEFYIASGGLLEEQLPDATRDVGHWTARGWRTDARSTCADWIS